MLFVPSFVAICVSPALHANSLKGVIIRKKQELSSKIEVSKVLLAYANKVIELKQQLNCPAFHLQKQLKRVRAFGKLLLDA